MNILVARTKQEIDTAYEKLSRAKTLGCDTETSSLSPRTGRIFSVQFSDGELGVLVPLSEGAGLGRLGELFANRNITKIFHNARFDIEFLREKNFPVRNIFCTMIAERLLTRGAGQSCSLAETLYRYFAVDLDKSPRAKFNKNWNGIWTKQLVDYALADVFHLPELHAQQVLWLARLGLETEYSEKISSLG